ncbi:MAG: hypothetical protein J4G18_17640, partial [Anaerolineae bacterium]|nr:hypothetical protein [Anaerolineae bacterium]
GHQVLPQSLTPGFPPADGTAAIQESSDIVFGCGIADSSAQPPNRAQDRQHMYDYADGELIDLHAPPRNVLMCRNINSFRRFVK